jgi:hypothetical protein
MFAAVAHSVHSLSACAFGGDSDIVQALSEDAMETLARSYNPSRGFTVAVNAMSIVAEAPNSEAPVLLVRAFTFDACHFAVRRCC